MHKCNEWMIEWYKWCKQMNVCMDEWMKGMNVWMKWNGMLGHETNDWNWMNEGMNEFRWIEMKRNEL